MAVYLLSAADVTWLGMEMPQCSNELECQVNVCNHSYVALGYDLSRKKKGDDVPRISELS